MRSPAFVDCYGLVSSRLKDWMHADIENIEIYRDEPADEDDLIYRLQGRRNVMAYMAYLSGRVLRACPDLQTVSYLSTGLATHADLAEAATLGIRIEGVKGYGDRTVAEHTITLALAALKRIAEMDRAVRAGVWELTRCEEIAGKTFGVVGLGGIGKETAKLAAALGAEVIAWTRSGIAGEAPVRLTDLQEVLARSDILTLHLALTPETKGFIDKTAINSMKPGVILVNTARAEIVNETAMMAALEIGRIGHCALDVFHTEPPPPEHPLLTATNVTLTAHSAWLSNDAIDRLLIAGFAGLRRNIAESTSKTCRPDDAEMA